MNLHIFGHSMSMPQKGPNRFPSFADILLSKYNCLPTNNHSAPAGSEERILYLLKKTKNIDVAIIFHSSPAFFFLPSTDRDLHIVNDNDYFWSNRLWSILKYLPNRMQDQSFNESDKTNFPRFDLDEFKTAYKYFIKYFYTRDLNANRHYGALVQIDQYLRLKKIKTIHCTLKDSLPEWFKFSHGLVDTEISSFQNSDSMYYCGPSMSDNSINELGNFVIANKLDVMLGALTKN